MNITKLIHSEYRDDIILAVELMSKMDAKEIKKLLPRYNKEPIKCWFTDRDHSFTGRLYKIHLQGVLYICGFNIYFTGPISSETVESWGYKNMD